VVDGVEPKHGYNAVPYDAIKFTCGSSTDACSAVLDCFEQPKQRVCTHGGREKRTAVAAVEN